MSPRAKGSCGTPRERTETPGITTRAHEAPFLRRRPAIRRSDGVPTLDGPLQPPRHTARHGNTRPPASTASGARNGSRIPGAPLPRGELRKTARTSRTAPRKTPPENSGTPNSRTPERTETPEKSASLAASRAGDRHGTPPTEGPGTHPLRDRAHIRRGPEDLPPRDPGTCPPRSPRSPTHRTAARRGPRSRFRQPRQKAKEAVPARAAAPDRAPPAPEGRKRQRGRRLHPRRRRRPLCPSIRRHPRRQRTRPRAGGRGGRHHPRRSPPHRPPSPPGAADPIVTSSAPRGHCREPAIFMPS